MTRENGFTLLEILVVIMIMGMLAAMAWPAIGIMDEAEKERISLLKMEEIRNAITGKPDLKDSEGNRIVGGFVGDMRRWPFLWEARAEIRPGFSGTGWENPSSMTEGLGQFAGYNSGGAPLYPVNLSNVFPRPSGSFTGGKWEWNRPFRRLDETAGAGAGDPETENEGQPRELWTEYPEDLPCDLSPDHKAPGFTPGEKWKGPYLVPPSDSAGEDAGHYAVSDSDYELLEPLPGGSVEEGCYSPSEGEFFDDREKFRLLQTNGRLADGWGRSFRFFITSDINNSGETLFWIISEGADREAVYPCRGVCSGGNADDVMGKAYNRDLPENRDNIVMKLSSSDWKALFEAEKKRKEEKTRALMEQLASAIASSFSENVNTGYTGDLLSWPDLYVWETATSDWDDKNDSGVSYVSGQPRGLWTKTPGSGDILPASASGIGWRNRYFPEPPAKSGAESFIADAWGQPLMFFRDDTGIMILSRGDDEKYTFGNPENPAEAVAISSYNPADAGNSDNLARTVTKSSWIPGFFNLPEIRIYNFSTFDHLKFRVKLFGVVDSAMTEKNPVLKPGTDGILNDTNSDGIYDEWVTGSGSDNAFHYDDATSDRIISGSRYLFAWEDTDSNGLFDSGEKGFHKIYGIRTNPAGMTAEKLEIDAFKNFTVLP